MTKKINLAKLGGGARVIYKSEEMIVTSSLSLVSLKDGTVYNSSDFTMPIEKVIYVCSYVLTTDDWCGNYGNYCNLCEVTFRSCDWGYRILVSGTDDYMLCKDFQSYDNAIQEYFELVACDVITQDMLLNQRKYEVF